MNLPADHPARAEREEETEAGYVCFSCDRRWFVVAFEGEGPPEYNVCLYCGSEGRRIR